MGGPPLKAPWLPFLEGSSFGRFGFSVWRCEPEGEWCHGGYQRLDHSDVTVSDVQYAAVVAVQFLISRPRPGRPGIYVHLCPYLFLSHVPRPLGFWASRGLPSPINRLDFSPHPRPLLGLPLAHSRLSDRVFDFPRPCLPPLRVVAERARDRSVALGCPPAPLCTCSLPSGTWLLSAQFLSSSAFGGFLGATEGVHRHSFQGFSPGGLVGRERDRSVALGCPPTNLDPAWLCSWICPQPVTSQLLGWLTTVGTYFAAFLLSLRLLMLLALWRLLVHAAPGRSTPLARFVRLPTASATDHLALPFRVFSPLWANPKLHRAVTGRKAARFRNIAAERTPSCSVGARKPRFALLSTCSGFCSCPVQVWAAPKELIDAVSIAADLVSALPSGNEAADLLDVPAPEPLPEMPTAAQVQVDLAGSHGHEADTVSTPIVDPASPAMGSCPGQLLPGTARVDPLPLPLGEAELDAALVDAPGPGVALDVPVVLAAAGYRIAHTTAGISFPSHVGALEGQARAGSAALLGECGDQLTPVYPQVAPGYATFVASPAWFAEAKLVVAFLDARAIRGHAFAIVLSFPTTVQEINRVAGFSSVAAHDIFVSGQPLPLDEQLEVALPTGALIRLLPPGSKPLWAAPLAFALWHPHYWPSGVILPRTKESACALVLHSSGKYLYDRFCSDDWANQNGIASLVGVPLAEIRMQAADPAEMLPYVYRGAPVRGVIALVERRPERDNQGRQLPYIVFLDSRPLGFDFNFVACEQLSLSIDWLLQYVQQPPPDGWRLVIKGGQRHHDKVDFFPGEVLILGLQRCSEEAEEQPESEVGFSSDPEQDEGSDSGDGHGSDSSTRSRSRGHTSEPNSKSEDRSYQGLHTPPDTTTHTLHLQSVILCNEPGLLKTRAAFAPFDALQVQVSAVKCLLQLLQVMRLSVPYVKCRVPDFLGQQFIFPQRDGNGAGTLPALRDIGDRSPRRPDAPEFRAVPQTLVPEMPLPTVRALFAVLVEGYSPEFVPLTLPVPCDIALAMSELQTYRLPGLRRFFPKLVPVPFQPAPGFAVFLAAPRWPKAEVEVLLDCRCFSGQLHAAFLPPVVNAVLLRSRAGIAWWRDVAVWLEPYTRPVEGVEAVRLYPGSVVVFLELDAPPPAFSDLATMLRSAECWDHLAPMPFLFDPALWILSDEGAFRFAIEGARPRRFVLAHVLEYDPSRLVAVTNP